MFEFLCGSSKLSMDGPVDDHCFRTRTVWTVMAISVSVRVGQGWKRTTLVVPRMEIITKRAVGCTRGCNIQRTLYRPNSVRRELFGDCAIRNLGFTVLRTRGGYLRKIIRTRSSDGVFGYFGTWSYSSYWFVSITHFKIPKILTLTTSIVSGK